MTCRNVPVIDMVSQKSNVTCLKIINGEVTLNKNTVYFTQCQIQMYVTGCDTRDLFFYSPV